MSGITGLNYTALYNVMCMTAIPISDHPKRFEEIRLIENGFLSAISEQRKKNGS
jgi:hypothetical protein